NFADPILPVAVLFVLGITRTDNESKCVAMETSIYDPYAFRMGLSSISPREGAMRQEFFSRACWFGH
ncbi:MAG: hypothetical protein IPH84_11275, partial [Bacteroidales bacterium]|nr:hypothetical protein [Bacteroidales bacterium]